MDARRESLLVILGAGASHDSVDPKIHELYPPTPRTTDYQPPLTDRLFDNRTNFRNALGWYDDLPALAGRIRSETDRGRSFEDVLVSCTGDS